MLGFHAIKPWSAAQGAYALSSAEAELHAVIEGVTRAKGLVSLAVELGFLNLSTVVRLGTDSNAAKSFVCRRGLGKMRHLEIRDLWLRNEVASGKLVVYKIPGTLNPADLMTKVLSLKEVEFRLEFMNMYIRGGVEENSEAQAPNSECGGSSPTACAMVAAAEGFDRIRKEEGSRECDLDRMEAYRTRGGVLR